MSDDQILDDTTKDEDSDDALLGDDTVDEKDLDEDIDPADLPLDEVEDVSEEAVVSPEEDPFGFGAFGELDEDGDYVAPATDDDDETEDEVSEDLF